MLEEALVARWQRAGVRPPPHPLVPDPADATLAGFVRAEGEGVQQQEVQAGEAAAAAADARRRE